MVAEDCCAGARHILWQFHSLAEYSDFGVRHDSIGPSSSAVVNIPGSTRKGAASWSWAVAHNLAELHRPVTEDMSVAARFHAAHTFAVEHRPAAERMIADG